MDTTLGPDDLTRWALLGVQTQFRGTILPTGDGRLRWTDGWLDKDDQAWVVTVDRTLSPAEATALFADAGADALAPFYARAHRAEALAAWFAGDAGRAQAHAARAREIQDRDPQPAWRFAELFQALTDPPPAAAARLAGLDGTTLWHAVAELFTYRRDAGHWRALWTICRHFKAIGDPFTAREREAAAALAALGVPPAHWRPTTFPGLGVPTR